MSNCFLECENLVSVANIPSGVHEMRGCFQGCIRLKTAPVIPYGVISMTDCFRGCKNLTSVTLKCGCTPYFFEDTFKDCDALGVGSIKVPKLAYNQFTTAESVNVWQSDIVSQPNRLFGCELRKEKKINRFCRQHRNLSKKIERCTGLYNAQHLKTHGFNRALVKVTYSK